MVWNARLPIESEFGESVRVVRCQRLLMFAHVERLDGGLNDAPGICPPPVCHDGRKNKHYHPQTGCHLGHVRASMQQLNIIAALSDSMLKQVTLCLKAEYAGSSTTNIFRL